MQGRPQSESSWGDAVEGWGGPPIAAKVVCVEPAGVAKVSALGIEEQRVRVILNLHEPPPAAERLGHEFRVFVKINVYEAQEALRLPISALFRRGEQWAVFTVESGSPWSRSAIATPRSPRSCVASQKKHDRRRAPERPHRRWRKSGRQSLEHP